VFGLRENEEASALGPGVCDLEIQSSVQYIDYVIPSVNTNKQRSKGSIGG
jgi:hypothetical protein